MPALPDPSEEAFAQAVARHHSPARAMREQGCPAHLAASRGHRRRRRPAVAARIGELQAAHLQVAREAQDRLLLRLREIAFLDIRDFLKIGDPQDDGVRVDLGRLRTGQFDVLERLQVSVRLSWQGGERSVRLRTTLQLPDRLRALEHLGRHLGM